MENSYMTSTILSTLHEDASTAMPSRLVSTVTTSALNEATNTSAMPSIEAVGTFFSWYDYVLFCVMLSLSLGIGIYFGCFGKKQTAKDYLHAGGNMKVLPVVISLVAR